MGFAQRVISLTFMLGTGSFGEGGSNALTVSGLRASCSINKVGGPFPSTMQLRVWGLTLAQMNQLTALNKAVMYQRNNSVLVQAGDAVDGMATVFQGTINEGWADFSNPPDAVLHIGAINPGIAMVQPAPALSFPGTMDVGTVMAGLANLMGVGFENDGVQVKLVNQYLPGTAWQQAKRLAEVADVGMVMDDHVLAIFPKGTSRPPVNGVVPLVSPSTGMAGYPMYNGTGIVVKMIFNPAVQPGRLIQVKSSLTPANGQWFVQTLEHLLEANVFGGVWFTTAQCYQLYGPTQ